MTKNRAQLRVVHEASTPDIYASKVVSTFWDRSTATATLGAVRFYPEYTHEIPADGKEPVVAVTGRIILSPTAIHELIDALTKIAGAVEGATTGQKPN